MNRFLPVVLALSLGCESKLRPSLDGSGAAPVEVANQTAPQAAESDPWAGRTDLIQPPPLVAPKPVALPPIQRLTLSSGLPVRIVASHKWPVALLHLVVLGGSLEEPSEKRGLAGFLAQMLTKGTRTRTADQIAAAIDFVGGMLLSWDDQDGIHLACQALSKDLGTCLGLLAEIAQEPTFPDREMGTIRDRLISSVKQVRDNKSLLATEHFMNLFWGEGHIRGWPQTIASANAITRADLLAWHTARFKPSNAILAVSGDVDPAAITRELDLAFKRWKSGPVPAPRVYPDPSFEGLRVRLVDKPDEDQTQIMVGRLGIARADPDYLPAKLANYTLGGGAFSSRLMAVVRTKGGKTYSASSRFEGNRQRGTFTAATFTRNAEVVATLKLVLEEMRKMRTGGVTAEELDHAKGNLAGKYPLSFETVRDVSAAVLDAEIAGLDEAYVREFPLRITAVPAELVQRVAAKYMREDNLAIVLVGKAEEVAPKLREAGMEFEQVGYLEPIVSSERAARRNQESAVADPARTARGRELLQKALQKKGGLAALQKLADLHLKAKGRLTAGGATHEVGVEIWLVPPDRQRLELSSPMGMITTLVKPGSVVGKMGQATREFGAQDAAQAREEVLRRPELLLLWAQAPETFVQARDPITEEGRELRPVEVRRADGSARTVVFLDPEGQVVRLEFEKKGEPASERYTDYRTVQGLQIAFRRHFEGAGSKLELEVQEAQINKGAPPF